MELQESWELLKSRLVKCKACENRCSGSLLESGAKPLFGRFEPWPNGTLFVFEAPNYDDTFDHDKGYLTYDFDTDPTGRFTRKLIRDELQLDIKFFQVTNAVLCLPVKRDGKFVVQRPQLRECSSRLIEQIEVLRPKVVVPVGGKALAAMRLIKDNGYERLKDAVARPLKWGDLWLFPIYHTSILGRGSRTEDKQRNDWRKLRSFLLDIGVKIPTPSKGLKNKFV